MRIERRTLSETLRYKLAGTLLAAAMLSACGASADLLTDIPESEANEVLAALLESNIRAKKVPGREGSVTLQVDQDTMARAIATLEAEGLPRERYVKMGDVFRKEGLISSPLEERARYLWALSQELSATVAFIDGVVKARVHVVLPERSSGSDPAMPSSAAVFIKYRHGYNIDDSIPQIKRLVANSIPGLNSEKVSVVLLQAMPKPVTETLKLNGSGGAAGNSRNGGNGGDGHGLPLYAMAAAGLAVLTALGLFGWRSWHGKRNPPQNSDSGAGAASLFSRKKAITPAEPT